MDNEKDIETTPQADDGLETDDISEESLGEENDVEEGEDAFEELYDDEENADEADEDSDSESDNESEEDSEDAPKNNTPDERDVKLAEALSKNKNLGDIANLILKEMGESAGEDAEEAMLKVAAEATGKTPDEIRRAIASEREANDAFEKQIAEDIKEIHEAFPEARKYKSIRDLPNVSKFAKLMDQGKSVKEAFVATHPDIAVRQLSTPKKKNAGLAGTKSHLTSSVPKGAKDTSTHISNVEMARLRETFSDKSDAEIKALYKKVSK